MAQVVAGDILAVLHKFDAVAEERAFVHARDKALDHLPRPKLEARNLGDGVGMQEPAGIVFCCNSHGWFSIEESFTFRAARET
jgi:hypothetical protein